MKRGYLSHCFKSRTRDVATPPLGSFIVPYVVLAMAYPTKKKRIVYLHLSDATLKVIPSSRLWILGYNFGFDQYVCAKFGTVVENQQPKRSQCSEIIFLTAAILDFDFGP